jgi:hypothetical protein
MAVHFSSIPNRVLFEAWKGLHAELGSFLLLVGLMRVGGRAGRCREAERGIVTG